MSDIRGEKLTFHKHDIVVLHSLPSAQAHDPCIVHAPRASSWMKRCFRLVTGLACFAALLLAALVVTVETGSLDGMLNSRAQAALNAALGDQYHADVASTVVRLTDTGALALKAQGVTLSRNMPKETLLSTDSVFIELHPFALLSGQVVVSRIEAEGATLAPGLLPHGKPLDLTTIRIADIASGLDVVFDQMDLISGLIARSGTKVVRIADVTLSMSAARNRIVKLDVHSVDFARNADGSMQIDGDVAVDGKAAELHLMADTENGRISRLGGTATGLPMSALLYRAATETEPPFGIDTNGALTVTAVRAGEGVTPELLLTGMLDRGTFDAAGMTSELLPSDVNLAYNFERGSIDVLPSTVRLGKSVFPFSGAVADLAEDAAAAGLAAEKGFSLDMLVKSGTSAPTDVGEPPLVFDAKVEGRFLSEQHALVFRELTVSSGLGGFAGSLSLNFSNTSPQISFVGLTNDMQTAGVKQLWPWWVGRRARAWVIDNIFGGRVDNAKIEVSIKQGRLAETAGPVDLLADELKIDFDIADARVNITGDIPPLRDASGHFTLRGERLDVDIKGGTAYFPSGRAVTLNGGDFAIPNTYTKPLMAETKLQVAGSADAIAELLTYRPLEALQKTPFKPEDFEGPMVADVGARFGLIRDQHPPAPQWQTEMTLDGVTLKTPISGRQISAIDGTLRVDPQQAVLDAKADVDGVPMKLDVIEPIGADSSAKRKRSVSGTLPDGALAKFAPGLDGIVDGPVAVDVEIGEGDGQWVTADLQNATVSLPWIGWSKGPGIGAKVGLNATSKDGTISISDFKLTGDSFGAAGAITVDKGGLAAADFKSVRLSAGDDYAVSVKRQKNSYAVVVNGASADVRQVIDTIKAPAGKGGSVDDAPKRIAITATLRQVQGFHSEALSNVTMNYTAKGRDIEGLSLSAVTGSGQAVVGNIVSAGADNVLELTSGDAGALARFADIYANMRGGLLNLKLRDRGASSWRGTLDIRKFSLADEKRLQSMVSTPTASDGRSLNQAVRKDIDVSSARFERGFANIALDGGQVAIDNGVVRGTDVGATFQGVLRDRNGNMDMTGTFMPAYGLNRLFGELPLIGTILGNGRDRGLLGITFKVTGSFAKPNLMINPLSIIAPGVFRNIFEFN